MMPLGMPAETPLEIPPEVLQAAEEAPERPEPPRWLWELPDLRGARLDDVVAACGINTWDVLLAGDGSGSGWGLGGGWAVVLCERRSRARKLMTGAYSSSTSMRMELLPYLHALDWYASTQKEHLGRYLGRPCRVHVLCDNNMIVQMGNGTAKRHGVLAPWWAAYDALKRQGFRILWHWTRRDKTALNLLCDHLSRQARLTHAAHVSLAQTVPQLPGLSVYDVNPGP
jgi:ribonuclease HI